MSESKPNKQRKQRDQTQQSPKPEDIIRDVVRGLVRRPKEVQVSSHEHGSILVLEVSVDDSDVGRVLGRSGRTFDLLKDLCVKMSGSYDMQILIELDTEEK